MDDPADDGESQMDKFERNAALVLSLLYEAFPHPIELTLGLLGPTPAPTEGEIQGDTIQFLVNEGFLRCGHVTTRSYRGRLQAAAFRGVVLTTKGLAVLNAVPLTLTIPGEPSAENAAKKPIGKRLMEAVRKGAPDVAGALARTAVTEGVKWLAGHHSP